MSKEDKSLPSDFEERKFAYGYYFDKGEGKMVTGEELKLLVKIFEENVDGITEFKGTIASKKGVVTGVARVILSPKEFNTFQKGDILVASETSPDYIPLMGNALAIVTDKGGVTSHAAIVSREMGKPCIIGTKIATQVLKSGINIEVNTDTGVVKILH
jgi:pyruvate,water dikinase